MSDAVQQAMQQLADALPSLNDSDLIYLAGYGLTALTAQTDGLPAPKEGTSCN